MMELRVLFGFKPESGHKMFMVNGLSVKADVIKK
jgi:hypothetical protein